jgi:Bacterial archaeo-eukaryotic release factor family 7
MMIDALSRESLHTLLETRSNPCISLFLPTDRTGVARQQDQLRIRRLIREAEHLLINQEQLRAAQVEDLLEPMRALLEDERFWLHASDGLAVFRSPEVFRAYRLPASFKERVVVGDHLYLKPLLPLLTDDGSFYVLALSHNAVRLLARTHYSADELKLPEQVPTSLAEFLRYEERENDLQSHSSASVGTVGKGGRHPAVFHGQGVGIDEGRDELLRYFQHIDRGLHARLQDETAPLVLSGVEYLIPIYQQANTYPHLLEQGVAGNPDKLKAETLREKAWALVESTVLQAQQAAAARYQELASTERASSNSSEIVPAAYYGRVESLFVAVDQEQWGSFDPATETLQIHEQGEPGDEDLLDLAATQTLLHGGAVYAVEQAQMSAGAPLAAVFRYASI